jgi:hypothetical protein
MTQAGSEEGSIDMENKPVSVGFEDSGKDPLGSSSLEELIAEEATSGMNRRSFLMQSALVGAMGVITGRPAVAQVDRL